MVEINGAAFARETRQMVIDMKDDIREIKASLLDLSNHYSKRIPPILAIIISGLVGLLGVSVTLLGVFIRNVLGGA